MRQHANAPTRQTGSSRFAYQQPPRRRLALRAGRHSHTRTHTHPQYFDYKDTLIQIKEIFKPFNQRYKKELKKLIDKPSRQDSDSGEYSINISSDSDEESGSDSDEEDDESEDEEDQDEEDESDEGDEESENN